MYSWRVTRKSVLWITVMLMIGLSVASVGVSRAQENGTTVEVEPAEVTLGPDPYPIGEEFTVNITLHDVTNLYGWEAKLFWDNTVLSATEDVVKVPSGYNWEDPNNFKLGAGIQQDYNATHGRWYRGLTALPMAEPHPIAFDGTTILVTITFNATALGETELELQEVKIANEDAEPISHDTSDGMVYVVPEFPASVILPLFLVATLVAIVLGKTVWSRKRGSLSVAKPNT